MAEGVPKTPSSETTHASGNTLASRFRNSRFKFIAGSLAAAGTALFGIKPKFAEAQMRPMPGYKPAESAPPTKPENKPDKEPPPPPEYVKNITDKAVKLLKPFMNNVAEVKVQYFPSETPNAQTSYEYNRRDDQELDMEKHTLIVFYPSDKKLSGDLELVVKQQLVVLANRTFGNYPAESFKRDFRQFTGLDIQPAAGQVTKLSAESSAQEQARIAEISSRLDLNEYKKNPSENLGSSSRNVSEKLYADIVTQFFSNKDLKARVMKAGESDRKMIASLYLAALKRAADCFGADADFKDSGVNQRALDDLLHISGNENYQKYFAEKRNPALANRIRLVDTQDYRAFIAQSAPKAA